tara:strand:- start:1880 stop:2107 length:228 start_codon:yes stop_codon:yes gene_type:complete
MAKKMCALKVKVDEGAYSFNVLVDTKYLKEWNDAGIDIHELINTVPVFIANRGKIAIIIWCFFQDLFNFKNPFKG